MCIRDRSCGVASCPFRVISLPRLPSPYVIPSMDSPTLPSLGLTYTSARKSPLEAKPGGGATVGRGARRWSLLAISGLGKARE
eukprot:8394509-Alexandrium_andersonii.AAC.1